MKYKKVMIYTLAATAAMSACKKESPAPEKQPDTNKIAAEAKRKEIHAFYRDSITNKNFKEDFSAYVSKNAGGKVPTIADTTYAAPKARNDFVSEFPKSSHVPGLNKFVDFCAEYERLAKLAR